MEEEKKLDIKTSPGFGQWLKANNHSVAFTTYQVGKVFMLGSNPDGSVHASERTFPRCMGLAMKDNTIWMSSIFQMWRFENSLLPGQIYQGYDKIYIPQMAYTTGDLDIHDIIIGKDDKPIFVNTMFNCLGTISEKHSFKPLWKPPFITKLVPEDRCHINGLAADANGNPKYVTIVGESDTKDGWRNFRNNGGIVMDVQTNEIICRGLSMPHSPRIYNGKVWILNAGTGYFGYINPDTKEFVPLTFCPGFLRGMSFIGKYAVVGMSKNRENKTFEGMDLDQNMIDNNAEPTCGLYVIDTTNGEVVEWVKIEGIVRELYDIMAMPNITKPLVIGTHKDEIKRMVSIEK